MATPKKSTETAQPESPVPPTKSSGEKTDETAMTPVEAETNSDFESIGDELVEFISELLVEVDPTDSATRIKLQRIIEIAETL